ncbi:MAG: hypothetical protein ACRDRO_17630 [Pseudonocardiaceae bacterium]
MRTTERVTVTLPIGQETQLKIAGGQDLFDGVALGPPGQSQDGV